MENVLVSPLLGGGGLGKGLLAVLNLLVAKNDMHISPHLVLAAPTPLDLGLGLGLGFGCGVSVGMSAFWVGGVGWGEGATFGAGWEASWGGWGGKGSPLFRGMEGCLVGGAKIKRKWLSGDSSKEPSSESSTDSSSMNSSFSSISSSCFAYSRGGLARAMGWLGFVLVWGQLWGPGG